MMLIGTYGYCEQYNIQRLQIALSKLKRIRWEFYYGIQKSNDNWVIGFLASTFVLAACGGGNDTKKDSSDSKTSEVAKDSSKEESKEMVKTAGGELKDGTYTLEEKNFDDKGWKVNFSMTVKDGKITKSDYDYLDKDGKKKSEDKAYQKAMSEKTKEKIGPADYIPALNEELV